MTGDPYAHDDRIATPLGAGGSTLCDVSRREASSSLGPPAQALALVYKIIENFQFHFPYRETALTLSFPQGKASALASLRFCARADRRERRGLTTLPYTALMTRVLECVLGRGVSRRKDSVLRYVRIQKEQSFYTSFFTVVFRRSAC